MQKLIDELELYPAKDIIPSELAEKILPVFQVNSEVIKLQAKPNYFMWQDLTLNSFDKTLTVPDNHTYVIKHGMVKWISDATVGSRMALLIISDGAGTEIWKSNFPVEQAASKTYYFRFWDGDPKAQAGEISTIINIPLPSDFVMKEFYTLRIHDAESVSAGDDFEISLIVDDQAD